MEPTNETPEFLPTPTDLIRYRLVVGLDVDGEEVWESEDDPDNGQPRLFATPGGADQFGRDLVAFGNAKQYRVEVDGMATLAAANSYWKGREQVAQSHIANLRQEVEAHKQVAHEAEAKMAEAVQHASQAEEAADALEATSRYLDSMEGGLWTITAQRDRVGNCRVLATHYPSGEIREATATAENHGVAAALLQLGNTIARDWDHDHVQPGLDEEAQRNLDAIGEALDLARREIEEAEETAGRAYSFAEDALGYIGEVEQPLDRAKDQAGDAQQQAEEAAGSLGMAERSYHELVERLGGRSW